MAGDSRCGPHGAPQSCKVDARGCAFWGTTTGQPALCSANQTCVPENGTCACHDDPRCGWPPAGGDFCPTAGAATHATCLQGADGCFTVAAAVACAGTLVCDIPDPALLVPTGAACGCPPAVGDQTGQTTKLLGTGCSPSQAAAGARVGSALDEAVLICMAVADCTTWQLQVACQTQQLTGGNDPVTSRPACVCKPPSVADQYFVDPEPAMATFMTGQPTGAQFPGACRYRTLTTALAQRGVKEVIATHESSSNVHFKTLRGSPGYANCNAANSCESFPLEIPAGVHLYTSDAGSFNPDHYVIDVDATSGKGYALRLGDGVSLEGYTIDASGTEPTGVNAGTNVVAVIVSPITGGWSGRPAVAPVSAYLDQVLILAGARAPAGGAHGQTALLIQGQAAWTADFLSIVGGASTARGLVIDHATDPVAGTTASLVARHLNVSVRGGTGQVGIELGTGGADNGVAGVAGPANADAGNALTVTNEPGLDGPDAFTPHEVNVGSVGVGVHVFNGTATVTGLDITGGPLGFFGYRIDRTRGPGAEGVTIRRGSISAAGTSSGGIGILAMGGWTSVDGAHISAADGWYGVSVRQSPGTATLAGDVTLTGTREAPTVLDVISPLGTAAAAAGIEVGLGDEHEVIDPAAPAADALLPHLTIADHTHVTHYVDGIVVNNGHVVASGDDIVVGANLRDGLQIFSSLALSGTDPNDAAARVSITGASFAGNGRSGVLIRDVVPVVLERVQVIGNGTPLAGSALPSFPDGTGGIDIQRSALGARGAGFPVDIIGSAVSGNTGCGITLSGGDDTLVNRINASGGVRVCGLGTGFDIDGGGRRPGAAPGPIVGQRLGEATSERPIPVGIFGGRTNVGGKVSAFIKDTRVQNNTGVGIYVTEARDHDPALLDDDVTDVSLQGNVVTGNLVVVPPTGIEPVAGGIYFAASNPTATDEAQARPLEVSDLGCEDPQEVSTEHAVCTRIRMSSFLGNVLACNGRAQLAFGVPQRISTSAVGTSPGGDWDIGSDGTIVGVSLPMRCTAAASPNTLAGYAGTATSLGLAIPTAATAASGASLLHVSAYGVRWNAGTIIAGSDFAGALTTAPQGNGDATTWGVCPDVLATVCPVALP